MSPTLVMGMHISAVVILVIAAFVCLLTCSAVVTNIHQVKARSSCIVLQEADCSSQITRDMSQKKYCQILSLKRRIRVI